MEGASLLDLQENAGQKRHYQLMLQQLEQKLSSKNDWYKFFEQNL